MAQHFKIDCTLVDDRRTLTAILAQNGYAVSWGKEKRSGKTGYVYFVEYWRPEDEREDAR